MVMVWYGMVWYGMVWYGMVWYGMVWYGMVWYGMVWYGMVWYGMVWYGMVWYGMVWYGMVCMYVCMYWHQWIQPFFRGLCEHDHSWIIVFTFFSAWKTWACARASPFFQCLPRVAFQAFWSNVELDWAFLDLVTWSRCTDRDRCLWSDFAPRSGVISPSGTYRMIWDLLGLWQVTGLRQVDLLSRHMAHIDTPILCAV